TSPKKKPAQATKGTRLKSSAKVAKSDKKKQPAKMPKTKGLAVLSEKHTHLSLFSRLNLTWYPFTFIILDLPIVNVLGKNLYVDEETDVNDDSKETRFDNDRDDLTHPNLSTYKADDEEEEKADDEEVSSDQRVSTPPDYELADEEENKEGDDKDKEGEQVQDEEDYLYSDVNINLERSDAEMADAQANQDTKDSHVTLTHVPPVAQQQSSSVSSDLVSKFINPSLDIGIDSILNPNIQSKILVNVPVFIAAEIPSSDTTIPQPPSPNIQPLQQIPGSTTTITIPTMTLPDIPNFASLFQFDQRVSALETEMFEFKQTNQFVEAISLILGIVDNHLASKMKEAVDRRRSGKEVDSSKEPTHKESKSISSLKGASRSQPKSLGKSAYAEEHGQKVDNLEEQTHQEFNTRNDDVTPVRAALDDDESQMNPSRSPTPDLIWKRLLFEDRTISYTSLEKATSKDFAGMTLKIWIEMDYLPKRKWSKQDKQRAYVMINAINKKLRDRRLMRNLEKFVGGRPYWGDLRLLERTI
nr:hypothetical protein [Tanacetum cinerariifolium]